LTHTVELMHTGTLQAAASALDGSTPKTHTTETESSAQTSCHTTKYTTKHLPAGKT